MAPMASTGKAATRTNRLGRDVDRVREGCLDLVSVARERDRLGESQPDAGRHQEYENDAENERARSAPVAEELLVVARWFCVVSAHCPHANCAAD